MTQLFEVADLFCGAGGSSTGAQRAIRKLGGELRLRAVNHWPRAIAWRCVRHSLCPILARHQPRVHSVDEPLPSVTSHGAGAVVSPTPTEGDVHYRMLKHRELARAMGFDDDEQQYEFTGTSTEITKQIGNAVAVNLAAALVTAVLGSVVQTEHGTKEVA